MYQERVVLCGANSYEEKYYFNEDFQALPEGIKNELKIMCVLFTNEIGGVLTLEYEEDGTLCFQVTSAEDDFFFDDTADFVADEGFFAEAELFEFDEEVLPATEVLFTEEVFFAASVFFPTVSFSAITVHLQTKP